MGAVVSVPHQRAAHFFFYALSPEGVHAELPKARAKQKELITAQQRVVQQAQVDEAARRQAENDSARAKFEVEKAAAIAKLRNQRRGYKDVCSYLRTSLSRGSNLAMEPLQCVNMGTVQSMEAAKAAGFIVTAIQGTATDPTFNLEKFD